MKDKIKNRLNKTDVTKRLKEMVGTRDSSIVLDENLDKYMNLDVINTIAEEEELVNFLKDRSIELFKIQTKNIIELGRIFSEVYNKLAKSGSKEGIYSKWLECNGVSVRTALRYRNRYEIYLLVDNSKKSLIATLPVKYIEIISSSEYKDKYIESINKDMEIKEIINNLQCNDVIEVKEEIDLVAQYNFKNYENLLININERTESLKEKEKIEIIKYLEKINNILNKN